MNEKAEKWKKLSNNEKRKILLEISSHYPIDHIERKKIEEKIKKC